MSLLIPATTDDQIKDIKQRDLSYRLLHPALVMYNRESDTIIETPFSSLTAKYRDFLSKHLVYVQLLEEDCANYRFRPKSFSYDVYGTTEFWNDILILNNCTSIREFDPKPNKDLIYYDPNYMKDILNEIMIIEDML